MLKDLFISKTRVKLLEVFLGAPDKIFYVRELVRLVGEQINAVRAELSRMERVGMLYTEPRANRKYYGVKKDYVYFDELLRMVGKSTGLGEDLIKEKIKLGKVKYAMFSGKFIRKMEASANDVDLLIVGNVIIPQLSALVKKAEDTVGREINYTVMTEEEFSFRKQRNDPFISDILKKSRMMIIGDEEEMLR
jgi:predicted transcriptional regulator